MADNPQIKNIIRQLNLNPHPEGGYFRETYRSKQTVNVAGEMMRSAGTGIYFLLKEGDISDWHRVQSDELWHFYRGDDLVLEVIDQNKKFRQLKLGGGFSDDTEFQHLVPQNCWQRAYSTGRYSLVGCMVSPGFEFEDFEMIDVDELAMDYPEIADQIKAIPFDKK